AGPVFLAGRFRFTHQAGRDYRHYIEATFYGLPVMKVNERYLNGLAFGETPFGTSSGEKVNQAANLGLWAESVWLPGILATDPRVSWTPVNATTAILNVPFGARRDALTVRFDAQTGLPTTFEAERYQTSDGEKLHWTCRILGWADLDGQLTPVSSSIQWGNDTRPWVYFTVENVVLNAEVEADLQRKGL
ncbi:MAG TPA: DUF6544 family protein, partial [Deinococcales bacterium]|nr:DUF6544 family protein [Deinococcales bacterium]